MNVFGRLGIAVALVIGPAGPAAVQAGDLDSLFESLRVSARADLGDFKVDLSATFGVPEKRVEGLFRLLPDAADVYMVLRIGELSGQPLDRVTREYQTHKGQGWGVIAKNLGIKPGSAEFHALKQNKMAAGKGHRGGKKKG